MRDHGLEEAIRAVGGVSELARQLGISQPSVSNWTRIPAERVISVESITKVPRTLLRPDLYGAQAAGVEFDEVETARAREYADRELPPQIVSTGLTQLLTSKLPQDTALRPEMQANINTLARLLQSGLLQSFATTDADFGFESQERDMDVELGEVLKVGQKFSHEYDFGSTTELALRITPEFCAKSCRD